MAVRSEQSHRSILESTITLLETVSVRDLSIERIAREAGVSKTTIYRWWPSKTALIIDSFLDAHVGSTPITENLPAIDALREHMVSLAESYTTSDGRLVSQLIGECQHEPEAMQSFKERFWYHRREVTLALVRRAIDEGALRSDLDPELMLKILYSPINFQLLWQEGDFSREAVESLLRVALEGISAKG